MVVVSREADDDRTPITKVGRPYRPVALHCTIVKAADIKPFVPRFDCFEGVKAGWVDSAKSGQTVADSRFEEHGR